MYLCYILNGRNGFVVADPPSVENYVDLATFGVLWLLNLVFFVSCVPKVAATRRTKGVAIFIYVLFFSISIPFVLYIWSIPTDGTTASSPSTNGLVITYKDMLIIIFSIIHFECLVYVTGILSFAALIPQIRKLHRATRLDGLSLASLKAQAVVFAICAVSWALRLRTPNIVHNRMAILFWYATVGWASLDTAAFAFVQFCVWLEARRVAGRTALSVDDSSVEDEGPDETQPLLG